MSSTGGAISNMYSVMMARYKYFPEVKTKGMSAAPRLVLFTSEHVSDRYLTYTRATRVSYCHKVDAALRWPCIEAIEKLRYNQWLSLNQGDGDCNGPLLFYNIYFHL